MNNVVSRESSVVGRISNFRELRIWQKSVELVEKIYSLTKTFPKEETYGLTSQIRRAAISIPSNIAEGFRRNHSKEYKQFLGISLGSCGEIETQLEIARRLGYLSHSDALDLSNELEYLCRMIHTLIKKLK